MADITALTQALRQGAESSANLAGLDERYARAKNLSNTSTARIDPYGQVSPLQIVGDMIGQSQGRRQMRELSPQRDAARQSVAANAHALPLYNASRNQQNDAQAQQNFEATAGARVDAASRLAQAKAAQEAVRREREAKMDARYDTEQAQVTTAPTEYEKGGQRALISRRRDGKWVDGNGNVMDSIEGWSETPKATITSDGSSYRDRGANKLAAEAINNLGSADRVIGLYNDLSPETLDRLAAKSTRIGKTAVNMLLPKDVASYVKGEIEKDPQVKQYFSALAQMSAAERHAMFGGALTQYEGMSADDFIAFVINMTPAEQQQRVHNSVANNMKKLRTGDALYGNGKSNYMNAYNHMGFKNLDIEGATPQEGSVNARRAGGGASVPAYDDAAEEAAYQAWKQTQGSN